MVYRDFRLKFRRLLFIILLLGVCFIGCFFFFIYKWTNKYNMVKRQTIVEHELFFTCTHFTCWQTKTPQEWIGLNRRELAKKFIFRRLLAFDGDKIVLRRQYHKLCPICNDKHYLGLAKHQVALYRGIPGLGRLEKIIPEIKVNSLPREEINDLAKGIPLANEKELLQIIEGWSENPLNKEDT